jgi:hypothetical protein
MSSHKKLLYSMHRTGMGMGSLIVHCGGVHSMSVPGMSKHKHDFSSAKKHDHFIQIVKLRMYKKIITLPTLPSEKTYQLIPPLTPVNSLETQKPVPTQTVLN